MAVVEYYEESPQEYDCEAGVCKASLYRIFSEGVDNRLTVSRVELHAIGFI